jgi:hypothetical protein
MSASFFVFRNADDEQWSDPAQLHGGRTLNGIRCYVDSFGRKWKQRRHATMSEVIPVFEKAIAQAKSQRIGNGTYSCHTCKAVDCKLWRPSNVFYIELICWRCLEVKGYEIEYGQPCGSDQVYDLSVGNDCWVPAVPDLNGDWWGYTSVPQWWVNWWKSLPNKKSDCTLCLGTGKLGEWDCSECSGSGIRK